MFVILTWREFDVFNNLLIKCYSNIAHVLKQQHVVSIRRKEQSHQWILQRVAKFRAANEDPINNSRSVFRGSFLFSQTSVPCAKYICAYYFFLQETRHVWDKQQFFSRTCFAITYRPMNCKRIICKLLQYDLFIIEASENRNLMLVTVRFVFRKLKFAVLPQQILLGNCGHAKWSLLFMVVQPQDNFL